jgi:hypothetical protein
MTARSATSYFWLLIKNRFSWTGSRNATVHELFDWMSESMTGRRTPEFNGDKLTCIYTNFRDTVVGRFVDALRETPNLDKFPDMPPRMMYLTYYLTKRIDFHPDAIERAIEQDHLVVRDLISNMGGRAYLEFVRERNIPLGADSLQYLGQFSDLSREEKRPFWREYVSINNKLSWISVFLQPIYMTYLIVKIAVILYMILVIPALMFEFITTAHHMMGFDDLPYCTPNAGMQRFIEACVDSFELLKCQTLPYIAQNWLSPTAG